MAEDEVDEEELDLLVLEDEVETALSLVMDSGAGSMNSSVAS